MKKGLQAILLLSLISCGDNSLNKEKPVVSLRDSVVEKYLSRIEGFSPYDSNERNYKILKAYFNNDTGFLREMKKQMEQSEVYVYPSLDSCVFPRRISDLKVDEAFRFIHSQSFCDFGQAITVTRSADSICLYYVEYIQGNPLGETREYVHINGTRYKVQSNCVIANNFKKQLHLNDWELLQKKLNEADFWGLKSREHRLILDGSDWLIDAYTKRPRYIDDQQIHFVSRNPSSPAFIEVGNYMLRLSGEKTMCGNFF